MSDFQFVVLAPTQVCGKLNKPALAISAARRNAIGVIDLTDFETAPAPREIANSLDLMHRAARQGTFGIKCSARDAAAALESLKSSGIEKTLLIISAASSVDPAFIKPLADKARKAGTKLAIEVTSLEAALDAEKSNPDVLIAKGEESAGLVGSATTFILVQLLIKNTRTPIWARGAIGEHSISALKAGGVQGVVLDNQLYLASDSHVPGKIKRLIDSFDGTETSLFQAGAENFRFYSQKGHNPNPEEKGLDSFQKYLERHELLPLGQNAYLANSLSKKGGTVAGIINILRGSIESYPELAARHNALAPKSPLSVSHNTKYPIVQGAMTRVSDNAEFARAVAENGALPFLALSLMRGPDIESLLDETQRVLEDKPWGVGILGFLPQQLREEQLAIINRFKPPFALIAGGRPDQAREMEENGISTYLHVPSPIILKSFIEMGARRFVFEGNECGGHVGPRSSFLLWEQMIEVILESASERKDNSDFHILFAGGIHDALSAKMVATMSAPLSDVGIKIGMLVGTAYLFTEEAVSTGAIVEEFQKRALSCGDTVLLETGPGHAIRCIDSPYRDEFESRKEELLGNAVNKTTVKEDLELMHLGRLRIASKGLERDGSKLTPIESKEQWSKGMYMIGQLAALKDHTQSMKELHEDISVKGEQSLRKDIEAKSVELEKKKQKEHEPVAIVGMSCNLPMSNDVESFWKLIINKVDAVEEVPETHWRWQDFYDKDRLKEDKAISKWGGFIKDIVFDPGYYGIPPKSLKSIDPVQLLILENVKNALEDAGYNQRAYPKAKTSMILANAGHGPIGAKYAFRSMLNGSLKNLLDDNTREQIRKTLPDWTEDTFPGILSNVSAGRVTNRFDMGGLNFCVDAACASSLAALYVAVNDLRSKSSDVVVLGSADTHNQPFDFLNFSKTHALSETGRCKTFDSKADGIVISEGVAAVILKRLSDAEKDGDKIYAVIRGVGGSSDGRALSLTAPRSQGQMAALTRAYSDAGVSPSTVELVEAHGTGTVAGDKAEVEALTNIFRADGAQTSSCAIGSVKTNIGHTKCTAGLASIIKVAKSLHHKVLPPTIGVASPNAACKFGSIPFYINSEARPWIHSREDYPRRAAVSAFGFGGTNFHTILEEYVPVIDQENNFVLNAWESELFVFRAGSKEKLIAQVEKTEKLLGKALTEKEQSLDDEAVSTDSRRLSDLARMTFESSDKAGSYSLAIVADSLADLANKLAESKSLTAAKEGGFKTPHGIYHSVSGEENKIGFLFPGQGSQRVNMLKELSLYFPEIRDQFESADRLFENKLNAPISSYVFPPPGFSDSEILEQKQRLGDTEIAQPAIGIADIAVAKILKSFGITCDVVAGHSWGEYVSLWQAGVVAEKDLLELSIERGKILEATEQNGSMLAVSADLEETKKLIDTCPGVYVANQNSPGQTVVSGEGKQLQEFVRQARENGISTKSVAVSRAFHSPFMQNAAEALRTRLETISFQKPVVPVFNNGSAQEYACDSEQSIRDLLVKHTTEPVMFQDQIENMYKNGVKTFVEVGPGSTLTSLVDSTLAGKNFSAIPVERNGSRGLTQFLKLLAQLWSLGHSVDLTRLFEGRPGQYSANRIDVSPKENRSRLVYKINSSNIIQLGADKQPMVPEKSESKTREKSKTSASTLNQMLKQAVSDYPDRAASIKLPEPAEMPGSFTAGDQTEKLLLEYQKNMLDMTNRFVEAQKEVMLAYLNGRHQTTFDSINSQRSEETFSISDEGSNGNGNGEIKTSTTTNGDSVEGQKVAGALDPESLSESLIDQLYEIVSERTGYPPEMLASNLDLEADLGIDSIKKIEIFNNFKKQLPETIEFDLEENLEELVQFKTLDSISGWIRKLCSKEALKEDSPSATANKSLIEKTVKSILNDTGQTTETASGGSTTRRELVKLSEVEIPASNPHRKPKRVLITRDSKEVFEQVLSQLAKEGVPVDCLDIQDNSAIESYFAGLKQIDYPDWIIFTTASATGPEQLLLLSKELKRINSQDDSFRPSLIVATFTGGSFCHRNADQIEDLDFLANQSALSGMANTIALEFDFARTLSLDFAFEEEPEFIAGRIIEAGTGAESGAEYCFSSGKVYSPYVIPAPLTRSSTLKQLDSSSLILVTGGARGITAEIALELARKFKCNFIVVGLAQEPLQEDSSTANLFEAKDIKKVLMERTNNIREVERKFRNLMKEREIMSSLSELKRNAASVKYFSVDVRDHESFGALLDSIYELNGNIDAVVHGAGIIEDAYIQNKSLSSFRKVFDTKVGAALTLADKLRFDTLKFLYFFSSVVGRTGNPGQIDYTAANETLNKLAQVLNQKSSCEVKSLMWGPWRGGMAPPELEKVIKNFGWGMIDRQAGRKAFMDELIYSDKDQTEVILVGNPVGAFRLDSSVLKTQPGPAIKPSEIISRQPFSLAVPVDIKYHDYLNDHCLDDMPVLPMAMAVEMILETATLFQAGRTVRKLEDFDIPAGVIFDSNSKNFEIKIEPLGQDRGQVTIHSTGKKKKLHHKCTVDYSSTTCDGPEISTALGSEIPFRYNPDLIEGAVSDAPSVKTIYDNWLFHGERFQGIESIERLGANGIAGFVKGHSPSFCFNQEIESPWILNPTLFDCALQLALIWSRYHFDITCLPTGFKVMHLIKPAPQDTAYIHIFLPDKTGDGEIICDLAIYDSHGNLAVLFEGLTGVGSKSFNRFANRVYASK